MVNLRQIMRLYVVCGTIIILGFLVSTSEIRAMKQFAGTAVYWQTQLAPFLNPPVLWYSPSEFRI
jgi:hypothetical protein